MHIHIPKLEIIHLERGGVMIEAVVEHEVAQMAHQLEGLIEMYLPIIIHSIELMGIVVLVIGSIKAFGHYLYGLFFHDEYQLKYQFANAMALALEFKLAAEILKTVIIRSFEELAMLGAIIILRLVMTFVIHWEMKEEILEGKIEKKAKNKQEDML